MGHKPKMTPKKAAEYKRLAAEREAAAPMTDREAEAEARRLWGDDGVAWHPAYARKGDLRYACVGRRRGDVRDEWEVLGHGRTFEEAFAHARIRGR